MFWALVAGCSTAAVGTYLVTMLLRHRSILDMPNDRSSHTTPIPRGGGIAVLAGTVVALVVVQGHVHRSLLLSVFLPAIAAGMIGLTDDLAGGVSVPVRFVALLAVAMAGATAEVMTDHPSVWAPLLAAVITLWVLGYTNFFNFMDGINGIASAETLLTGITLGVIAIHLHRHTVELASLSLAAASLGFLPFNFPRARVFLGDVGSYFSGASLALLVSLAVLRGFTIEAAVAPLGIFLADATFTLLRRIVDRKPWATAHREHTYQRLVDHGWSHTLTTGVTALFIAACSGLGSVSLLSSPPLRACADFGLLLLVTAYLFLPWLQTNRVGLPIQGATR